MVTDEDTLPFDIRMVTPGTLEYAEVEVIDRQAQRNLDYFLEHESALMEQYRNQIVVVYNGGKIKPCASPDEMVDFLLSLDRITCSSAMHFTWPEEGTAWAL